MATTIDATVIDTVFSAAGLPLPSEQVAERYPATFCYPALHALAASHPGADFGLALADRVKLDKGTLSLIRFVSEKAPTLRRAFIRLCRFAKIVDTGIDMSRHERGGRYHLRYANVVGDGQATAAALWLGLIYRTARDASSKPCAPVEVHFRANLEPHPSRAAFFDGAKVLSQMEYDALVFDSAHLDLPLLSGEPTVAMLLEDLAQQRLRALEPLHHEDALNVAIVEFLDDGAPMGKVCAHLGISPRTLQRRLKDQNTSYRALLDDVRRKEAERDLLGTDTDLSDIATTLGYASVDALSRACRRWFGQSPSKLRANR